MARKSRKENSMTISETAEEKIYNAGLYARLSALDNGQKEGRSLENQIEQINRFVLGRDDLKLVGKYCDNGATGTNFKRPAWENLMEDVKNRTIDCIIVKDFSRLGRNYLEAGNYIEKVFPFLGVRFIAINDNYDSTADEFNERMLENSLKNLVNEYYARDISKKVIQYYEKKQKNGELAGSIVPYGYCRASDNPKKLAADTGSSPIVQKIFFWRSKRMSCTKICKILNELAIPSPGQYRYMKGDQRFKRSQFSKWTEQHIADILENPVYLGDMVQGRYRNRYFEPEKGKVPEENWIVVKNTHEPLITEEEFLIAKEMSKKSKRRDIMRKDSQVIPCEPDILKGKLYCGICGHSLYRHSYIQDNQRYYYFACKQPKCSFQAKCKDIKINSGVLLKTLEIMSQKYVESLVQTNKLWKSISERQAYQEERLEVSALIQKARNDIEQIALRKKELYVDMQEGLLSKADFLFAKEKYGEKIESLKKKLQAYKIKEKKEKDAETNSEKLSEHLARIEERSVDYGRAIEILIDRIWVYSSSRIKVRFTFEDEWKVLEQIIKQKGKAANE